MTTLTSRIILEYVGSDLSDDELDEFVQAAIDIVDEALESAKAIIEHNINIKYKSGEQFEVSVI